MSASEEANRDRWKADDDAWRGYARRSNGSLWWSDRVRAALSMIEPRGGDYLDIGCATGVITRACAEALKASTVHAVDFLEVLDPRSNGSPPIQFQALNLDSDAPLPFADSSFDLVTCFETLEHLHDTDRMAGEVRRVLRPGGQAIFSVPRIDGLLSILMLTAGLQPPAVECSIRARYGSPEPGARVSGHVSNFTLRGFCELMRANGLTVGRRKQAAIYGDWAMAEKRNLVQKIPLWCLSKVPVKRDVMIVEMSRD